LSSETLPIRPKSSTLTRNTFLPSARKIPRHPAGGQFTDADGTDDVTLAGRIGGRLFGACGFTRLPSPRKTMRSTRASFH
jgi:hypothetical protein